MGGSVAAFEAGWGVTQCTGFGVEGTGGGDITSLALDSLGDATEESTLFAGDNRAVSLRERPPAGHGVVTLFCVETCHCNCSNNFCCCRIAVYPFDPSPAGVKLLGGGVGETKPELAPGTGDEDTLLLPLGPLYS